MRFHAIKSNGYILIPKTMGSISATFCILSLVEEFSVQDKAIDAAQPAPHGDHYHVDANYVLSLRGINRGTLANSR